MRTKFTILSLSVIIIACTVSIARHVDVLWVVPQEEVVTSLTPPPVLGALFPREGVAGSRVAEGEMGTTTLKSSSVTIIVDEMRYEVPTATTQTILAVMQALTETTNFSFGGIEFPGLGFFVDEINHRKSSGGYYWMLYVNMRAAEKGVSQMVVSPGDEILWRYEKNQYAF